jgi:hypothetical protein
LLENVQRLLHLGRIEAVLRATTYHLTSEQVPISGCEIQPR